MGGGGGQQSQTTRVELSPEQREILGLAMPRLRAWASSTPRLPDFSMTPDFTPEQTRGQEMALASAEDQAGLARSGRNASNWLLSREALDPNSNPALRATIDASTRPITQNLMESVFPALRTQGTQAGQFGGSRRGIAEGLATGRASQAIGDTAAKVATAGYQSGLDAQAKALGLLPQTTALQTQPALTVSGVGDVRQARMRELLGEQINRFNYPQMLPLLMGRELASIAAGLPGGGTTTTASQPQGNPLLQALGIGAAGTSLLSSLGAFGGGAGAAGAAGAAGGLSSLLPFLMMSDRKAKEGIRRIGALRDGTPVFRYRYLGDSVERIGFMADSVRPDAVHMVNGVPMVDYRLVMEGA